MWHENEVEENKEKREGSEKKMKEGLTFKLAFTKGETIPLNPFKNTIRE